MKYMTKTSREAGVCPSFDVFCCGDDCMDWVPGDCTRALAAHAAKVSGWTFNYKKGMALYYLRKTAGGHT